MADAGVRPALQEPVQRLGRGGVELLCHTAMVCLMLGGIKLVEVCLRSLWGPEKLFFNRFPAAYVFDGADLLLLAGFLLIGVPVVIHAYYFRKD